MGLDMHLYAEKYISAWNHQEESAKKAFHSIVEATGLSLADLPQGHGPSGYITFEVAYWRKANAIHKWFVVNVQDGKDDCEPYHVSRGQLKELVDLCKLIKAEPHTAAEKLPTQSGFFFGGTGYGEDYIADLDSTIIQIEAILTNPKFTDDWGFQYQSSW